MIGSINSRLQKEKAEEDSKAFSYTRSKILGTASDKTEREFLQVCAFKKTFKDVSRYSSLSADDSNL